MRVTLTAFSLAALAVSGFTAAHAGDATKKMMKSAMSAAPASITDGATIMDPEGNVLREGVVINNAFRIDLYRRKMPLNELRISTLITLANKGNQASFIWLHGVGWLGSVTE